MAKRRQKTWTILLILGLVFLALPGVSQAWAAPSPSVEQLLQEIRELEQKLQQQEKNKKTKQAELKKTQARLAEVRAQLQKLQARMDQVQKRYEELQRQLQEEEARLAALEADLKAKEEAVARHDYLLQQRLVALYKGGRLGYMEVLLSATSFSDFVSRLELLHRVAQHDLELLRQAEALRAQVEAARDAQQKQRDKVAALKAQVAATRSELGQQIASSQRQETTLSQEAEQLRKELDELERSSQEIAKLLQEKRIAYSRAGGFSLIYPLKGGPYRVTSPYGMRYHPILKEYRLHSGTDIGAPAGTPVLAAESGVVVYAGWMGGYGNIVVINHGTVNGQDMATAYAHLSKISVTLGQEVAAGQVIGNVGSTGNSTGPHLHFEVRVNGNTVDPEKWIKLR
ncbi:MAG: peptidoglycan DD-metalloendopeptidase family protein [Clostridiales bacterium]|nr:peptidoglycan DD-metalloendopeptidase family protein [Clostridiales bacterium]